MSLELIEKLESKVKSIENEISQTVSRHSGLLGLLQGTKEALLEAKKIADTVAPNSSVTKSIDEVVDVLESSSSSTKTEDVPQ